jgi:S-adenosylmethionine decarboxylase
MAYCELGPKTLPEKRKLQGVHLTVNAFECASHLLASEEVIGGLLDQLPDKMQMTKISTPVVCTRHPERAPEDWGISGFILIAESHISIHTFPERGYAWLDAFSCKQFKFESVRNLFLETFQAQKFIQENHDRGFDWASPEEAQKLLTTQRERLHT